MRKYPATDDLIYPVFVLGERPGGIVVPVNAAASIAGGKSRLARWCSHAGAVSGASQAGGAEEPATDGRYSVPVRALKTLPLGVADVALDLYR